MHIIQVRFFGNVEWNEGKAYWWGGQEVVAKAYDVPIPGKSFLTDTRTLGSNGWQRLEDQEHQQLETVERQAHRWI